MTYTPVTPCRLADTRVAGGALGANSSRDFKVFVTSGGFTAQGGDSGNCNVPANPPAAVVNIAAVNIAGVGNLIAFPAGGTLPNTSVLNYQAGTFALSNGAIVPACLPDCANQLTVKTNGAGVDVVIDIVGYFRRPTNYLDTPIVTGAGAFVGGGEENAATGDGSVVGGGEKNAASATLSVIGGGYSNTVGGDLGVIGGGWGNNVSGSFSAIGGGNFNLASDQYAFVGGGQNNTASGLLGVVAGGQSNTAAGLASFAAGYHAKALADGSIVFADSSSTTDVASNVANEFVVAASGGIKMATNRSLTTGCFIVAGGGTWNCTSAREVKRDFVAIDPQEVLRTVTALPLSTWRFMNEDPAIRHLGPMAQDFRAAFALGSDDQSIAVTDANGVALAAIQGLHQLPREKDREIADLKRRVSDIESLRDEMTKSKATLAGDR